MITYEDIKRNEDIRTYIMKADESLLVLGYTEHSFQHVTKTAEEAGDLLRKLGKPPRVVELARIAGHMHDIGNVVNRVNHSLTGAVMAFRLLDTLGMNAEETAAIVSAIGNHDESTGTPVNDVAAALILADKCDVRRSRVRNQDFASFDIHDRVNYAVERADMKLDVEGGSLTLELDIDSSISSVMDYFEIFLQRMLMCRRSAEFLGLKFGLEINGGKVV